MDEIVKHWKYKEIKYEIRQTLEEPKVYLKESKKSALEHQR